MTGPVDGEKARAGLARPPLGLRRAAAAAAALYLASLWLDATGCSLPRQVLPRPLLFFAQVAELFPRAAQDTIEWRVRGWQCEKERFEELDVRPLFPIHRDDKENQFDRTMFFFHRDGSVLEALDAYLVGAENRANPSERIGGVMLLSLRVPIPPIGEPGPRRTWEPIHDYPSSVARKYWYTTPPLARQDRCKGSP